MHVNFNQICIIVIHNNLSFKYGVLSNVLTHIYGKLLIFFMKTCMSCIYSIIQRFFEQQDFLVISPSLYLFDLKYSKSSNIVEYLYYLK